MHMHALTSYFIYSLSYIYHWCKPTRIIVNCIIYYYTTSLIVIYSFIFPAASLHTEDCFTCRCISIIFPEDYMSLDDLWCLNKSPGCTVIAMTSSLIGWRKKFLSKFNLTQWLFYNMVIFLDYYQSITYQYSLSRRTQMNNEPNIGM